MSPLPPPPAPPEFPSEEQALEMAKKIREFISEHNKDFNLPWATIFFRANADGQGFSFGPYNETALLDKYLPRYLIYRIYMELQAQLGEEMASELHNQAIIAACLLKFCSRFLQPSQHLTILVSDGSGGADGDSPVHSVCSTFRTPEEMELALQHFLASKGENETVIEVSNSKPTTH